MSDYDPPYVPDVVPEADAERVRDHGSHGNRVGWGDRPGLLIVDLTRAFVEERPAVADPCVEATARLRTAVRAAGLPVVYAKPNPAGTFPRGYPSTVKATPGSSRGPDPEEAGDQDLSGEDRAAWLAKLDQIVPELEPGADDPVIEKARASAFFDTHLGNVLRYYGVDTLLIAGMSTSGCVRATAVDSHSSNFRTVVPIECVADRSRISHEVTLFDLDMKYADVTPLEAVIERVGEYGDGSES